MALELIGEDKSNCRRGEIYSITAALFLLVTDLKKNVFLSFFKLSTEASVSVGYLANTVPLIFCRGLSVAVRAGCWFPPSYSAAQTGKCLVGEGDEAKAITTKGSGLKLLFLSPVPRFSYKCEQWTWVFSRDSL